MKEEVDGVYFAVVFLLFPILVVITSVIGYLLLKKWFVVLLLTFVIFTVLTFTVFDTTFFIWVIIFTLLSAILSLLMKFTLK